MSKQQLDTASYKGVRDFYPEQAAIQEYIFDVWRNTVESFGYERYDASILEPAELYRAKSGEELANEQTYTFTDRGDREVTLRPEMTPTVARMVAAKRRELSFPLRWYSIPNLFRYERPQRGRLREHWQLNCDIFGADSVTADVEVIFLGYSILKAFGADDSDFEIRVNNRTWLKDRLSEYNLDEEKMQAMMRLIDRKDKIDNFEEEAEKITGTPISLSFEERDVHERLAKTMKQLNELGVTNAVISPSTVRGLDYYSGTVFEMFDTSPENNRALFGGGRYDNLVDLFGGEPVSGVGFGMGDVALHDFLSTHNLLPEELTRKIDVIILPLREEFQGKAESLAATLRNENLSASVDLSGKKLTEQITRAKRRGARYVLVLGEDEIKKDAYTLKNLETKNEEVKGNEKKILEHLKRPEKKSWFNF